MAGVTRSLTQENVQSRRSMAFEMNSGPLSTRSVFGSARPVPNRVRIRATSRPVNGLIEAFNGRLRAECLNENWFLSLDDARAKAETWRRHYNRERPHNKEQRHRAVPSVRGDPLLGRSTLYTDRSAMIRLPGALGRLVGREYYRGRDCGTEFTRGVRKR